jgi:hypothetical protein
VQAVGRADRRLGRRLPSRRRYSRSHNDAVKPVWQDKRSAFRRDDAAQRDRPTERFGARQARDAGPPPTPFETTLQEIVMNVRNKIAHGKAIVAITLALGAPAAFADDSSMSVLTGDSYAYFNHLDYSAGKFNMARAATPAPEHDTAMKMPQKAPAIVERPTLLAGRSGISPTNPFSDDKGA